MEINMIPEKFESIEVKTANGVMKVIPTIELKINQIIDYLTEKEEQNKINNDELWSHPPLISGTGGPSKFKLKSDGTIE